MYRRLLKAEFLKIRKKWVWFLMALGPVGVLVLQAIHFLLRYETLNSQYGDNMWGALGMFVLEFIPPVLILGMSIITSILASIEHENASWKQLLAISVRKRELFTIKFIVGWILLFVSCLILFAGMTIFGLALGFGTELPWRFLMTIAFLPYLAAMPILALQIWLAVIHKNQGIALTVGVLFAMISFFSIDLPGWFPISWPTLQTGVHPVLIASIGVALGSVIFIIGRNHFVRKDV